MIKHIILFKFKQDVSKEERNTAINMLRALKNKIPEIKEWEIGTQRQQLDGFYDFAQVSSFKNIEALDSFRQNPEHKEVKEYLKTRTDWIKVDYDL